MTIFLFLFFDTNETEFHCKIRVQNASHIDDHLCSPTIVQYGVMLEEWAAQELA